MADNQQRNPAKTTEAPHNNDLIAVGVGASAGGLEAFTDLVKHLPSTTGMAFILVQHLDPHHTSALPELLADKTRIPVLQIQGDTPIQPDRIYVIPPNTLMRVRNRTLVLEARPEAPERFRPIDVLFDSLAQEFRFNAVGIVLSGTASDGTQGLKTIKAEGGITFAQNQTAKFDSMPRSAISAGAVDFVLAPRRMAEELTAISHRTVRLTAIENEVADDGSALQRVLLLLRNRTGVNFAQYKQPTILRRLQRRMILRQTEDLEQYLEFLQREPEEIRALFDEMLINVTGFFRDPEVFEAAKQVAFPAMLRGGKRPLAIRVWVPGCSSGEEVYSMAIALVEFLSSQDLEYTLQIFGTDISEPTIDKARAGIYDDASVANLSPERLRRFFVRTETGYQINRAIRDVCIFSRHNVATDPPLSRMDLISCRNLLIYLAPSLQRRVIARFGYALQPNGCLILGASETLGGLAQHFHTLDEPHRIYSRNASVPAGAFDIWESRHEQASVYTPVPSGDVSSSTAIHSYVDTMVLSLFAPAALVVDPNLKIIEFRGDTAPYVVAGRNERNAVFTEVVHPQFRPSLAGAIEQARRTDAAVVIEGGGSEFPFKAITVIPFALFGGPRHFLILFGQQRDNGNATAAPATSHPDNSAPRTNEEDVAQLKQELKTSREYLQTVIEELRSTNEEAQSANEELQSTNEEMQTSKEELQSANEELHTINAEMQSRNSDLARANDDLINLLSSMNMPIVMTGSDLRIRRFTPVAERMLRLIPGDIGRPIADLKPRINVPNLEEILRQVVETLEPHEQEVQDEDGRLYLMRVRAYRTADHRIDGTVLQLVDVTELKRSMEEVRHARDYAEAVVNTVREPLVVLDRDLAIVNVNRAFYSVLGVNRNATLGQKIFDVAGGFFDVPEVRRLIEQLHRGPAEGNDIEIEKTRDHGQTQVLSLSGRRLQAPNQQQLILIAVDDITERKLAAEVRYRRLFESARDGIVLVDAASGEILDLNPYTERLLGHSRNELVGRPLWEIEPLRNATGVRAAVQQIADMGAARFDDFPLRTREGQDIQAEVMASLYTDGDRRAIQFNIRDVSERKKFERELRETQKLESLGLLAGGIAHDFNNLLTGIMGNASLAYTEAPVDQPLRIRLRDIVHAAERAAFLTRQMLAYSGRGRFVVEPMDVGELIREISALLLTSIPKRVELKLDLAPDLPQVEADTAQIQQVMMNLVINGAEAIGDRESGRVEVSTSLREIDAREAADFFGPDQTAPGPYVAIEVRDTGAGMDEATKARIFDPFFTTKFTGRGLGLAAVQGIVKGHRGCIRVYSTPGHGTSFLILLPAVRRKKQPVRDEREPRAAIPPGSVVLVIDDEETIRNLTRGVLTRTGMKVLTAVNGAEGVEMFREHKGLISLVILDLLMPVMGGEEAIALMQEIDPQVPVILSSGFDVSEAARRFEKHKPARFLQKPYTADRLLDSVAATLKRP